jgi:hypothetical protein
MLKNITSKYMTSPLRTLLDSTPHLKYPHGVGEDIFEYTVVPLLPFQVSLQIYYEPKVDQHHNIQQKRGVQNHQSRL